MKGLEIYPTTKVQIYQLLARMGLNRDVIELIYKLKYDTEIYDSVLYHKNNIIYKTLKYHINPELFKTLCDEYIYHNYFKFSIPMQNGTEWCIRNENDSKREFIANRIDVIFDPNFIMEKMKKSYGDEIQEFSETKYFESDGYIYFEPKIFRKIKISNKLCEGELIEIYEDNDVYIYHDPINDIVN